MGVARLALKLLSEDPVMGRERVTPVVAIEVAGAGAVATVATTGAGAGTTSMTGAGAGAITAVASTKPGQLR